jgi:hypothetical protein
MSSNHTVFIACDEVKTSDISAIAEIRYAIVHQASRRAFATSPRFSGG